MRRDFLRINLQRIIIKSISIDLKKMFFLKVNPLSWINSNAIVVLKHCQEKLRRDRYILIIRKIQFWCRSRVPTSHFMCPA